MRKKIIFGLIICLSLSFINLSAQTLDYKIEKPAKLYVGTPFKMHMYFETGINDSIFAPQTDTLDIFIRSGEILQQEEIIDDIRKTNLTLTFQGFDTGEFTFPELEFTVKKDDGNHKILKTNSFQVFITSVITDSSQVIKDIAAPLSISLTFWDYLLPILVLIIGVILIIWLKKILKRDKTTLLPTKTKDIRPAWQICLEMLQSLKKQKLLDHGEFLEFYYRLSIILRHFIELEYRIKAVEMTTSEIRESLRLDDHKEKSQIMDLLSFSDRVKFAKFNPSYNDSESKSNWLEQYLNSFKEKSNKTEEDSNA